MERGDLPRHAWGDLRIAVDVEHESGVGQVLARFRHEEWPSVSVECSATIRANFLGRRPQRASVVLWSRQPPLYPGPYRLERLLVRNGKGEHEVSSPKRLDFYLEENPSLPDYERNVRRFVQGEEVSLEVEASSRYGVKAVTMTASGGYGGVRPERVHFRGEGDGSENCRVLLKARIGDSQRLGRYRAHKMEVVPSSAPSYLAGNTARSEQLHPPLVFEVLKNEDAPPPPPEEPKSPNWGFSG